MLPKYEPSEHWEQEAALAKLTYFPAPVQSTLQLVSKPVDEPQFNGQTVLEDCDWYVSSYSANVGPEHLLTIKSNKSYAEFSVIVASS